MSWLLKLLFRLADKALKVEYLNINEGAVAKWLLQSYNEEGFREYFRLEDIKILKALGIGQDREQYLILIGRRLQLLMLMQDVNKSFQMIRNKQEAKAKEHVEAKKV